MKQIKNKVKYVLEKYPATRDSDKALYFTVLWEFMKEAWIEYEPTKWAIKTEYMYQLPSFVSVVRSRCTIQNTEGLYPPSDEILIERGRRQKIVSQGIVRGSDIYDEIA